MSVLNHPSSACGLTIPSLLNAIAYSDKILGPKSVQGCPVVRCLRNWGIPSYLANALGTKTVVMENSLNIEVL